MENKEIFTERDRLLSLFFILFDAQEMILRKITTGNKPPLEKNLKMLYNQINRDVNVLRRRFILFEDMFFDIVKYSQYDQLRKDSNFITRINMLTFDRCQSAKEENLLENFLKKMPEGGIISKGTIESFRMR